jgi:uncharacterized protein (TIGR02246 family)
MTTSRIGIWLIGAKGGVATTAIVGIAALNKQLIGSAGLVSGLPQFQKLPLADWDNFVIGGHEIRRIPLCEEAKQLVTGSRTVSPEVFDKCREELAQIDRRLRPGTIRNVGPQFSYGWAQADAEGLSLLFTPNGDIRHPDGSIERGRAVILANRLQLFARREYQRSKHPLQLNDVRCLSSDVAIADGKWELRLQQPPQTTPGRGLDVAMQNQGWCTLVMMRREGAWGIEAWRYTVDPPQGTAAPTLLSKPGFTGRQ